MAAKNEHTGDTIQSKKNSKAYRDNFDKIFKKKGPLLGTTVIANQKRRKVNK